MGRKLMVAGAMALVVIAGLLAGCGSSSSDTTAASPISKSEFLAKGNAICTKGNKQTNALAEKTFSQQKQPTQAQLTAFGKAQVPLIQSQIDQIKALGAPSGDEATVKQMITIAQSDLDKIKADPASAGSQTDHFANFAKIAHPYGLTACDKSS